MRKPLTVLCIWLCLVALGLAAIRPETVAVLYNDKIPESKRLAETYAAARKIPTANLIGLPLPEQADISRAVYETQLRDPLREEFENRKWWQRARDDKGITIPVRNKIRVIAIMRGVPLRIQETARPKDAEGKVIAPEQGNQDEASVDSELMLFGAETLTAKGALKNPYFQNEAAMNQGAFPFAMLTARIDAAAFETCIRMIEDAIEIEKTGLWGMAYVDVAHQFPQGDEWMENIYRTTRSAGIPVVVDRFKPTFPAFYPMTDAALYFGWYAWHADGPLMNPEFRFRKGAVAVHLHSFSAQQLRQNDKNWCAPILAKGAAATLGNVHEPYLHLTHHLDIFEKALLDGKSLVEAAWLAMPVASWQGVVLGDPLYRPFLHLDGSGTIREADRPYRAIRAATLQWPADVSERIRQLEKAAGRMKSPILMEAVGLEQGHRGLTDQAAAAFAKARESYRLAPDKIRQDFHRASIHREAGRETAALQVLREAHLAHEQAPEAKALQQWIDLLAPPPTP